MNDQENKTPGDNLEEFLSKAGRGHLEDDFEKDAAEGFAMLEPGEAHELKAQTDRRVASLFSYGKRKLAVQWSIAAGVVLLVSMTVYFLRQDVSPDNSAVVQNDISEKKEELLPGPAPAVAPSEPSAKKDKAAGVSSAKRSSPANEGTKLQGVSAPASQAEEQQGDEVNTEAAKEAEQSFALSSQGKAEETPPSPTRADEGPKVAAAYSAARTVPQTAPETKSKDRAYKKQARPQSEPAQAAPRETSVSDDAREPQLNLLLRKKLEPKIEKTFSAIVTIKEGTVRDVRFTTDALSKREKKEIEKTLRALSEEELRPLGITNGEVKLDYRP